MPVGSLARQKSLNFWTQSLRRRRLLCRASTRQCSSYVLGDAPEDTGWVRNREVPHAPGAIGRRLGADTVRRSQLLHVSPPGLHVFDEQVHHEVARVLRLIEILEQKTAVSATQIGKVGIRPRDCEAQILVKLLGERISRG